jgi:hypothetical protein
MCVATNRDTASMEKRYPNPDGSRTFCHELVDQTAGEAAVPGRFRATFEPTGDMEDNPTEPGGTSTSRTDLLSRSPPPVALLAQVAQLPGPPLAFPREGVRDWPRPRCVPSGELPEGLNLARQAETDPDRPRVSPCPQAVPNLWRRSSRLFFPAQDPALTGRIGQGTGPWRRSAR